jgi:hypothetical protein
MGPMPVTIDKIKEVKNDKAKIRKDAPTLIKNKIELQTFTSSSVAPDLLKTINSNIFGGLKNISGKRVFHQGKINADSIKYIILGNVEDTGSSLRVYARIIEKETSATRYMLKKEISKSENIEEKCKNISKELSKYLK